MQIQLQLYLASIDQQLAASPWTSLRDLEYAVQQYEKNADELDEASLTWINQLIAPGSSLGGARPKADVVDTNGKQWIAKFPGKNDDADSGVSYIDLPGNYCRLFVTTY